MALQDRSHRARRVVTVMMILVAIPTVIGLVAGPRLPSARVESARREVQEERRRVAEQLQKIDGKRPRGAVGRWRSEAGATFEIGYVQDPKWGAVGALRLGGVPDAKLGQLFFAPMVEGSERLDPAALETGAVYCYSGATSPAAAFEGGPKAPAVVLVTLLGNELRVALREGAECARDLKVMPADAWVFHRAP